jgi:hypothetical protein
MLMGAYDETQNEAGALKEDSDWAAKVTPPNSMSRFTTRFTF